MSRTLATSTQAAEALKLVSSLQQRFVSGLEAISTSLDMPQTFQAVEWLRDEGLHGGGIRYETADGAMIGRGSVNVSQVHYDDSPDKKLGSATAISTIIHPENPTSPSVHIHISWTEMKSGQGYWRIMADLNPSNDNMEDKQTFLHALKQAAPEQFETATQQGDTYFYIPVLARHRGIAHFYLEAYNSGNAQEDHALAEKVGQAAMDTYMDILKHSLEVATPPSEAEKAKQLAYHTLYFFQVLTLDRGTTTGLLVHNQNDVGIMGSLPARVDKSLLQTWVNQMPKPQDKLLQKLIDALPDTSPALVDKAVKQKLAEIVRSHYQQYPEAMTMQASGHHIPPTVQNHQ